MMQAWLGLSYVDIPALWALFAAFGASIIQVFCSVEPCHVAFVLSVCYLWGQHHPGTLHSRADLLTLV